MASLDPLYLEVLLKDRASSGLRRIKSETKKVGESAKVADKSVVSFSKGLKALGAAAVGALVIRKLASFAQEAAEAFMVQEQAVSRLRGSLQNAFGATEAQVKSFERLAASLSEVTTFSDEAIISGTAMLGTFKFTEEQLKAVVPRMLDMAAAMEKATGTTADLESVAVALGKGLTGQVGALTRYGVVIGDELKAQIEAASSETEKLNLLLQALDENFAGIASASAQSLSGQLRIMKNQWGDVKEEIGEGVVPALIDFFDLLIENKDQIITTINLFTKAFGGVVKAVSSVVDGLTALAISAVGKGRISEFLEYYQSMDSFDTQTLINDFAESEQEAFVFAYAVRDLKDAHDEYARKIKLVDSVLSDNNLTMSEAKMLINENIVSIDSLSAGVDNWAKKLGNLDPQIKFAFSVDELKESLLAAGSAARQAGSEINSLLSEETLQSTRLEQLGNILTGSGGEFLSVDQSLAQRLGFGSMDELMAFLKEDVGTQVVGGQINIEGTQYLVERAKKKAEYALEEQKNLLKIKELTRERAEFEDKLLVNKGLSAEAVKREKEATTELITVIDTQGDSVLSFAQQDAEFRERAAAAAERELAALRAIRTALSKDRGSRGGGYR